MDLQQHLEDLTLDVRTSVDAVGSAVANDLARSASSGADISVDLDALRRYYDDLAGLDEQLGDAMTRLNDSIVDAGGKGADATAIAGVRSAMQATAEARNGSDSLVSALGRIRDDLRAHLESLFDNYTAYLAREDENTRRLTGAETPAEKPLGW